MKAIKLYQATLKHADALGALHVASWYEAYTGIMPDEMLAVSSVETRTEMWRKIIANREAFGCAGVFIAEDNSHLIGFGSCGRQRDQAPATAELGGEIMALYVLRSHQKRGVGSAIMAAMAECLSDQGYETASLWVLRDNAPARAFYESLGGTIIGEKMDERFGGLLVEIAYGWSDLSRLVRERRNQI